MLQKPGDVHSLYQEGEKLEKEMLSLIQYHKVNISAYIVPYMGV